MGRRPAGNIRLHTHIITAETLARLHETFEESTIPYEVDVVDLSRVAPEFRERVRREGQRWVG